MLLRILKSKIHRATVTEANMNYMGSITIDRSLLEASGIYSGEIVNVFNITNGNRFETYVIEGDNNKKQIIVNGAAARLVQPADKIIIISYGLIEQEKVTSFQPKIIILDDNNQIIKQE